LPQDPLARRVPLFADADTFGVFAFVNRTFPPLREKLNIFRKLFDFI
jgi:hypothetical protein